MNFPSKTSIRRSLLAAALCGLSIFIWRIADAIRYARIYTEATRVEFQVNLLLERGEDLRADCANPSNKSNGRGSELMFTPPNERAEFCTKGIAKADACKAAIERVTGSPAVRPIRVTDESLILSAKECGFLPHGFWANFRKNLYVFGITMQILIFSSIVGIIFLSVHWLFEYSHIGWRRLLFVVAPIVGIGSSIGFRFPMPALLYGAAIALVTPIVCLTGREVFLWIKTGFENGKDG